MHRAVVLHIVRRWQCKARLPHRPPMAMRGIPSALSPIRLLAPGTGQLLTSPVDVLLRIAPPNRSCSGHARLYAIRQPTGLAELRRRERQDGRPPSAPVAAGHRANHGDATRSAGWAVAPLACPGPRRSRPRSQCCRQSPEVSFLPSAPFGLSGPTGGQLFCLGPEALLVYTSAWRDGIAQAGAAGRKSWGEAITSGVEALIARFRAMSRRFANASAALAQATGVSGQGG